MLFANPIYLAQIRCGLTGAVNQFPGMPGNLSGPGFPV